jgi:MFS family permease
MSGVYYHVVSIFLKAGFSGKLASAVFGASWILSGIGSLCSGAVANRLGTKNVLAGSLLLGATGTLALAFVARAQLGMMSAGIFVVLWGATANAVTQFLPILLVERFGSAHLGALIGVQSALMGLAGSFAPMVTGTLYDAYASYQIAILACTVATVIACALVVGCGGIPGSARFTRIGR